VNCGQSVEGLREAPERIQNFYREMLCTARTMLSRDIFLRPSVRLFPIIKKSSQNSDEKQLQKSVTMFFFCSINQPASSKSV